jgi:hypothetical protein
MSERGEIVETIVNLFVGTDDRDWTRVRHCFAPHVHFDMTSLAGGKPATLTPEQIVTGWAEGLKDVQSIHHQAGNFLVTLNGDEADAFCYATAYHYRPDPSGRNTRTFVGSYEFHLIRTFEQWKIDSFRFNLKFIDP